MIYIIEMENTTRIVPKFLFESHVRYCKNHGLNWVINRYGELSRELVIVGDTGLAG